MSDRLLLKSSTLLYDDTVVWHGMDITNSVSMESSSVSVKNLYVARNWLYSRLALSALLWVQAARFLNCFPFFISFNSSL